MRAATRPVASARMRLGGERIKAIEIDPRAPESHVFDVRDVYLNAGAGFMVVLSGEIMTMPGLPKVPASENIDVDADGNIVGLA